MAGRLRSTLLGKGTKRFNKGKKIRGGPVVARAPGTDGPFIERNAMDVTRVVCRCSGKLAAGDTAK